MEIDWTDGKQIELKHNESIEDVKIEFPEYKYAVVMKNNYQNGTDGKTRWIHMDYEDAICEMIGCCMAENQAYVYDLHKNCICKISKEDHEKSWKRITNIKNFQRDCEKEKSGVDISLKALQQYADKNGIKKMVKDMSFAEKEQLRILIILECGKEIEDLSIDERK